MSNAFITAPKEPVALVRLECHITEEALNKTIVKEAQQDVVAANPFMRTPDAQAGRRS